MDSRPRALPVDSIIVPAARHRGLQPASVAALVESFTQVGQLQPIAVAPDHTLIYGRHRLEAARRLQYPTIMARVLDVTEVHRELMEIDENLCRADLDTLERAEHLKRRKELYEAEHPETKHGGDRVTQKPTQQVVDPTTCSPHPRFTADAATLIGVSEAVVQQEIRIATNLSEQAKEVIRDTALADRKTDLLTLAQVPDAEVQQEAALRVVHGDGKVSMKQAIKEAVAEKGDTLQTKARPTPSPERVRISRHKEWAKRFDGLCTQVRNTDPTDYLDVLEGTDLALLKSFCVSIDQWAVKARAVCDAAQTFRVVGED